jgi:hypothetical protein
LVVVGQDVGEPFFAQAADNSGRHPFAFREHGLTGAGIPEIACQLAFESLRIERCHPTLRAAAESDRAVEERKNLLLGHSDRFARLQRAVLSPPLRPQGLGRGVVESKQ